ncbi:MAG: hypothetical protein AAGJ10_14360 [Bacteroidota bacterium]
MTHPEDQIRYALRLIEEGGSLISEELFKLASLADAIAQMANSGQIEDAKLITDYRQRIKAFYLSNGAFRAEVERFTGAKQYVKGIEDRLRDA